MKYKTIEILQRHHAQLIDTVRIGSGMQMAAWSNQKDTVSVCSDHHTLSLYIRGGYESYRKTASGWQNGGAPDRFCLMPQGLESTWDVRDHLNFVHLYYTDQHLKEIAVKIWDKEPANIQLNEKDFGNDTLVSSTYRHFLLNGQWQDQANQLQFSTASNLLLNHLIQNYSNVQWKLPYVSGGLSPYTLNRVLEWIQHHLHLPITIADLALQANLSEYHFAHMFKKSVGIAPHQFVLQTRLQHAHDLVSNGTLGLTEIALASGFSSASHFSTRFKQHFGYVPSQLRQTRSS